jgi:lipopolysaccharide/colanic/teichoic acid biosynthesis glycosyltransferase
MKRLIDVAGASLGLIVTAPITVIAMLLVWLQDFRNPFYIAPRVELRSMVMNADRTGVDSTASNDQRITRIGHAIRRYKLDELTQLWNVLRGDMSLVGPRPNVKRDTDLYTAEEQRLLQVRPGITDFSSIVFSDEGEVLKGRADPDIAYNQLIRPWKSRLGLFYVDHPSILVDLKVIALTALAIINRQSALEGVAGMLGRMGAPSELIRVARRENQLRPTAPPGATEIVTFRG